MSKSSADGSHPIAACAIVLMGVAGSGKTTVGRLAAKRLGWRFIEGDDLHSPENRAQMREGRPLSDAQRRPWLDRVRRAVEASLARGESVVVACSALRPSHRSRLARGDARVRFLWLDVPPERLRARLEARRGHFAGAALLASQLAVLDIEADARLTRIDGAVPPMDAAEAVARTALEDQATATCAAPSPPATESRCAAPSSNSSV